MKKQADLQQSVIFTICTLEQRFRRAFFLSYFFCLFIYCVKRWTRWKEGEAKTRYSISWQRA